MIVVIPLFQIDIPFIVSSFFIVYQFTFVFKLPVGKGAKTNGPGPGPGPGRAKVRPFHMLHCMYCKYYYFAFLLMGGRWREQAVRVDRCMGI